MKFIQYIIKRKTFISMLFIALTMLGYISYKQLSVELYPNSELPVLFVSVNSYIEVDPNYIEKQAIIPIEGAVSTLENIKEINSFVRPKGSFISIYFNQNTKLKYAYLKLREKVDAIKSSIPAEFIITVIRVNTEEMTNQFMGLQVRGSGGVDRVRNITDEDIVPKLESIDGIASVQVSGGREKTVEIILNDEACKAYHVTPRKIQSLIMQNSENKVFAGKAYSHGKRYFVNVSAEYRDIHTLGEIVVNNAGPVRLKDVAEIYFGVKEQTSLSRVNGKEAVTVQLIRENQTNQIDLSHDAKKVIDDLNSQLALKDLEILIQTNSAEIMEKNINLIVKLAIIGGCVAILILWIFLRQLQLVLLVMLAIPISVFTAFNFFYAFDITVNSLTAIGMALAIGMLLDNSIVVLENIYRKRSKGIDEETAVAEGTIQVGRSVFAGTFTTIAVFLPFVFTTNFFFKLLGKNISVSIISTLFVSLAVAILLIPTATHYLLKRTKNKNSPIFKHVNQNNRMIQIYTLLLKSGMRFPARTIICSILAFFIALLILLGSSLFVSQEPEVPDFDLYLTMHKGTTLDKTDLAVKDLEKRLEGIEEIQDLICRVEEDEANLTVKLKEKFKDIDNNSVIDVKGEIEGRIDDFPTGEVSFNAPASSSKYGGGGYGEGAEAGMNFAKMFGIGQQEEKVVIIGEDYEQMRLVAEDIEYYLEENSPVESADLNLADKRPEVHLLFDIYLMDEYNISPADVSSSLSTFQREFSSNMTFKQGNKEYDISIKSDEPEDESEKTMYDLEKLTVSSNSGETVDLSEISNIIYSTGMSGIHRVNQEKQIKVTYWFPDEINNSKSFLEAARLEVDELITKMNIPEGIAVEVVHDDMDYSDFYFLFGAAFILILMILASVFESLFLPFVILFSIPLAGVGSFLALTFTGNSLMDVSVLIGMLILLGIVVNNGIILIDYANILRRRGYRKVRALMVAGQARVRPILITAITTIVAMTPLAMGQGEYVAMIGAPFAITVIGGLMVSTLLTLIFIPTFYSGLESSIKWIGALSWKLKILLLVIGLTGIGLVYTRIDTVLLQVVCYLLLLILIPASAYFIMVSLKRTSAELIPEDEPITIKLQNLVKIYDREPRFVREWNGGKRIRERAGLLPKYRGLGDFQEYIWQIPLLGFFIYFAYFYLNSGFWLFLSSVGIYFYLFYALTPFSLFLKNHASKGKKLFKVLEKIIYKTVFWGFPLFNLVIFHFKKMNIAMVILVGLLWYIALIIYTVSNRLHSKNVNIERITGRFSKLRRQIYRLIKQTPLIGRKRKPFCALDRVSLDIGKGMFGLLGPNGAGKTTMMRIICGILDQSYGKITINDIDIKEKREELQGLIGYLPQEFGMYENMSAYDFLQYQAMLKGITEKEMRDARIKEVLKSVHMIRHKNEKINSFSGGMKQRIGIAQILLHLPRILVVDEPTAGLDPRERIRFRNLLVELSRDRIVIFSTHIIEDISSSCQKVAVLNRGELKYLDEPQKMTTMAEGHVWMFRVGLHEFEQLSEDLIIVHHMRDGDRIRVRCISEDKPHEDAKNIKPSLEDAYLWLLKGVKKTG